MNPFPPNLRTSPIGGLDAERTRQLLDCVFRVLGHDLPNHLIAVQGLARLLAVEEDERLSPEGKDYVARMAASAERAQALAVSLSSAVRLLLLPPPPEVVDVRQAIAEAVATVKTLCPGQAVAYDLLHEPILVTVPRPSLDHVLVGLLRQALAVASENTTIRVGLEPSVPKDAVEIAISDVSITPSGDRDFLLARLLVEAWTGNVRLVQKPTGRQTIFVTCPRR